MRRALNGNRQHDRPEGLDDLIGVALCVSLGLIRSELYHVSVTLLLTTFFLSFIIMARLNIV